MARPTPDEGAVRDALRNAGGDGASAGGTSEEEEEVVDAEVVDGDEKS